MPRACTVCTHPDRERIEHDVAVRNGSIRAIADRYDLSRGSLIRHIKDHLPEKIAQAAAAQTVAEADKLIETIQDLQNRSKKQYEKADKANRVRDALMAIREERETVKLLAEVEGHTEPPGSINIYLMSDEEVMQRAREILKQ